MADEINFSSLDSILKGLKAIIKAGKTPVQTVPPPLIYAGGQKRSGLSASKTASAIIKRKAEAGLPVGSLPNGDVNPDEIMERIRAEEYFKAFMEDAKLTIVIPPGSTISAAGACLVGPVTVAGATISFQIGYGIIQ